ncbi:hypothetical protein CO683_35515 [Bradyrhizobium ottawaense]|uniref:DUF3616 domain-containing protein n=1 Tax=Bradyrhizobium ottawaense TaxID=931866 RepID=UPI000BE9C838|nr:DUF3616 domain-containing protein [Bradyrhizobium ottawaense]PDT64852.1 hypothetical protein CO683_35515 [Bradyrhizobium ottawaense]
MKSITRQVQTAILVGALAASGATASRASEEAKPVSGPWEAGEFTFPAKQKKTRKSLSGIACKSIPASSTKSCLVVFDEGTQAHYVAISSDGYTIDNTELALRSSDGELDAEGATTDGEFYYVTGSHSAKRNSCESNPGSRHVIRFAVDPATGKARPDAQGRLVGYRDTGALWGLMAAQPALEDSVGEQKCLGTEPPRDAPKLKGQRGVNIEGIAAGKDGALHFGLRGPAVNGNAPVLTVDAHALFEGDSPKAAVTLLEVGTGRGIRDLTTVKDGILVLAGPDDDKSNEKVGWIVGLWSGIPSDKPKFKELARLALDDVKLRKCDDELKPEAIAVLKDERDVLDFVIMSDGMCDGGPLRFTIARKD